MWYALMHTSAKYMTSTLMHSLYKQNSPLSRLDFFFGGSCKPFNINAEKRKFYSSTVTCKENETSNQVPRVMFFDVLAVTR